MPNKKNACPGGPGCTKKNQICKVVVVDDDEALVCDCCGLWFHIACQKVPKEAYKYASEMDNMFTWYCSSCKLSVKKVVETMSGIHKEVKKNTQCIGLLNQRVDKLESDKVSRSELQELQASIQELEAKLLTIETRVDSNEVRVSNAIEIEGTANQQQNAPAASLQESELLASKRQNLIIFGVPDSQEVNPTDRANDDFVKISSIVNGFLNRPLRKNDFLKFTRIGEATEERPKMILIKFKEPEMREMFLKNNKGLSLRENNVIHKVFINIDYTKSQRECLKKLRDELKTRREAGERDLVIRQFRIVPKFRPVAHDPWAEICKQEEQSGTQQQPAAENTIEDSG